MTSVQEQLRTFATTLLEQSRSAGRVAGGRPGRHGRAPAGGGRRRRCGRGRGPLAPDATGGGLCVNLAGDFLEWSGRLLDGLPKVGAFRIRDVYLKRKDLDETIHKAFTWPNAKVKLREVRETAVEYHTWWFHASISSEDRWETCFCISLNSASGAEVEIPDPLGLWELQPRPVEGIGAPSSYPLAVAAARRRVLQLSAAFLDRMDSRLVRDRKRLDDYYRADCASPKRRRAAPTSPPIRRKSRPPGGQ